MRGLLATSRAAIAEVAGNRRALLFQMGVMIVNDLVWVAFWVLFFRTAGTVRGWDADRVILLLSVMTVGAGLALGVLSNARHLPARLTDGSLDAVLGLPTGPLGQLLVRRIEPVNVGDVVFGIGLFAVAAARRRSGPRCSSPWCCASVCC